MSDKVGAIKLNAPAKFECVGGRWCGHADSSRVLPDIIQINSPSDVRAITSEHVSGNNCYIRINDNQPFIYEWINPQTVS